MVARASFFCNDNTKLRIIKISGTNAEGNHCKRSIVAVEQALSKLRLDAFRLGYRLF